MALYKIQQARTGRTRTPSVREQITRRYYEPDKPPRNLPRGQTRISGNPPMISVRCGDYAGETPVVSMEELRRVPDDFENRRKLSGNKLTMDEEIMRKSHEAYMRAKWAQEDAEKAVTAMERVDMAAREAAEQARKAAQTAGEAVDETRDAADAAGKAADAAEDAKEQIGKAVVESAEASKIAQDAAAKADEAEARTDEIARAAEQMKSDIENLRSQIAESDGEGTAEMLGQIVGKLAELTELFRYGDAFVKKVGDFDPPKKA